MASCSRSVRSFPRLTYDEEMERVRKLLEEVSSDEETIEEEIEDSDNEDVFSEHQSESEEECRSSDDEVCEQTSFFVGKDKTTKWQKEPFRNQKRIPVQNIIKKLPGNTQFSKHVTSPIDAWRLIFDDSIIEMIVKCTNTYVESISGNFKRERDAKPLVKEEFCAFVGLLYIAGLHKSSHVNVRDLWATDGTGLDIFRKTMNYKRFLFILRVLRFDDIKTRNDRRKIDKLAPVRNLFEHFIRNCQKSYHVGEYVTLDEKLESFRGRCSFRQYMPKKPARYGLKIFALVDSRTFYTYNMEIYAGQQPDGPYKTDNSSCEIAKRLLVPLYNSGRNVTTDNWYTSYELAEFLQKQKISIVGTIRKNRKVIPPEFASHKNREEYTTLFGFQKNIMILSYMTKKNNCVNLLSTMHNDNHIDESTGDLKKPEVITFYNMTKGAVDVVDEMGGSYSVARISNRWPMVLFFSLLNITGINSRILLLSTKTPPEKFRNRRHFLKDLAFSLLEPHMKSRQKQQEFLDEPQAKKQKLSYRRCYLCPREKDKKSKTTCLKCEKNICREHSVIEAVCTICKQSNVSDPCTP
ncbi:piggyBac transposable element-derived protein 4-like [Argiope bruennichi]|uniref:piggyBac transposable element-derived protein 4-like n=1 Tax=Argiope bruennichi TaxID=94029 RepID=UPI0024958535|nr:piggyBac transposable element-derived protein 4-like [Argiope bruennichi]